MAVTPPKPAQVTPSVEYCQVPLPVLPVMAIPSSAPVSTSAQEAELRMEATVVLEDVVSSLVPLNVTVAPLLMVGASFTLVTVIEAVADWLEYAVVPPPAPGLA